MISVVIPSLNSGVIDRVIAALLHQTAPEALAEIIVVGQDERRLIPASPKVCFINSARARNIAEARNLGARFATGDYLFKRRAMAAMRWGP